jgi:hypothetical protein
VLPQNIFGVRGSYKNGHWDLFSGAGQRNFPNSSREAQSLNKI